MKNLFFLVFSIFCLSSFAQITNIKVGDKIKVDRLYVGSLSNANFHLDSLYYDGYVGVRLGAMGTYKPVNWLSFSSWSLVDISSEKDFSSTERFWVTITPTNKVNLFIGLMTSLPTEMRPHPLSGDGQFETWSQASIPGSGLGFKMKYQITKDLELGSGVVLRKTSPEYSMKFIYKKLQISAWYNTLDSVYGIAAVVDIGRVFSTFVYKPNQVIADVLVVKISEKENISVYSDVGYSFVEKKLVRGEWGLLKAYESKFINGLIGLGYEPSENIIKGYFFIHI